MNKAELKQEASELRRKLGFNDFESISFKSLLLKEKILTYFSPLDDDFSGMALKLDDINLVLINSAHSLGRQHFTICHELFHIFIDKDFSPHKCKAGIFNKGNKSEYLADIFASHFLLPENGLLSMIPRNEWIKDKIQLATILKLEQYYACSRRALVNRLYNLRFISFDHKESLCNNISQTAQLYGFPVTLYKPDNKSEVWGDYGTLAKTLFDNEKISEGQYASLMADIGIDIFEKLEDNGD